MLEWDETYDLVVVGSGAGSMCAALVAQDRGKRALIIEKLPKVGGTTALSGGVIWIPNNPLMKRAGRADSYQKARTYLDAVLGAPAGRGSSSKRREAYLKAGPEMVGFLEARGMKFTLLTLWPDYYDDRPGGEHVSRGLFAKMFNLRELGKWEGRLNVYPHFDLPVHSNDMADLTQIKRTRAGKMAAFRVARRTLRDKLTGSRYRSAGAAIQGRMLQLALRCGVSIWTESPVAELVMESDRVAGVVVVRDGQRIRVQARDGVLINAGGFARSAKMREQYQRQPRTDWTNVNVGDTGEMLQMAMRLGAATENMDATLWMATSLMPNGDPAPGTVHRGQILPMMLALDMGKPGCILVDSRGRRFVNESASYMEVGEAMFASAQFPCWFVMDQRNRDRYMWGGRFGVPQDWLESGFIKKAAGLEELAQQCGIDALELRATVLRFNGFAREGKDLDFNRGGRCYDQWNGDQSNRPNPSLGTIEKGPFYAVAAFPGDIGTFGGLVCDEHSRVLREDGTCIPGLYATGNSTSSVMGRFYPGPGATNGPSFVFGYVAALHAMDEERVCEADSRTEGNSTPDLDARQHQSKAI